MWAAFLVIVVFSFVIWGTQMPNADHDQDAAPGQLNGKPVSGEEFSRAYRNSHLAIIMAMGRRFDITREIDAQLRRAAWYRLATLAEARRMGLTASPPEISNAIQSNPAFAADNNQFYKPAYKAFIERFLHPMGFSERAFEQHVSEEILMQKVRYLVGRSVLVPPVDMRRTFSSVSDRFQIEHVVLGPDLVTNSVKVTEQDAKAYFDKDPAFFEQPEKMKVKYVRFAVAPFIPQAKVEADQVQAYYDQNMTEFLRPTNELAASTNALGTNALFTSKYKPFEEVKQEINNRLKQAAARDLAAEKAMEFVLKLTRDSSGKALSFEEAAAEFKVLIEKAGPFAERERVEKIDAGPDFNRAAFALTSDPDGYFSDVIRGEDYAYVLALEERVAKRIPDFAEIKDDVLPLAQAQAVSDALGNKAKEVRDAALKAIKAGQSFASAVTPYRVPVFTSGLFTASTGPTTNDYSALLMRGVMPLNQGEVSEILPAPDAHPAGPRPPASARRPHHLRLGQAADRNVAAPAVRPPGLRCLAGGAAPPRQVRGTRRPRPQRGRGGRGRRARRELVADAKAGRPDPTQSHPFVVGARERRPEPRVAARNQTGPLLNPRPPAGRLTGREDHPDRARLGRHRPCAGCRRVRR
jgi:hypothetical protein